MAHRAATDEICVTGGMGNAPSSKRRGLVRVSACCLLAPKDLACHGISFSTTTTVKTLHFSIRKEKRKKFIKL